MALQWISGTISRKQVWSDGLFTLFIHCPGVTPHESGQFHQVGMQLSEKHLHRPYSVASPHGDTLEFFIVRVDEGELTPRLWNMKEGDAIDVSAKATGGFTLSHTPSADCIWLLATGTGLAPYIAMLRETNIWERYKKIVLVHGVRFATDLAYQDELKSFHDRHPDRFHAVPVVSRAEVPGAISGRITTAIEKGTLESATNTPLSADNSVVMMCGNPQMLDDVEALLGARGMTRHKKSKPGHIVVERYW
ncbi:MAG: ferredoxin--NADP reductase [Pirellula sp.]